MSKEILKVKIEWYGSAKHYVYHRENPLYTEIVELYDEEIPMYVSTQQDNTNKIPIIEILDE